MLPQALSLSQPRRHARTQAIAASIELLGQGAPQRWQTLARYTALLLEMA
jgi:hypothetical protein